MTFLPSRHGALSLVSAAGCGLGLLFCGLPAAFPISAAAQTVDSPAAAVPAPVSGPAPTATPAAGTVQTDAKGRHLAPHGTFFLLGYVSVTTDSGVIGFTPGQEVHLVEVHRPTHTLVVTDGQAQVEVSPARLTNDLDIAALVRQQDQANQAQIAAYVQAEEAAYAKHERDQAEQTARDEERQKQAQAAEARVAAQAQATPGTGQPVDASFGGNGYYGTGGEGYGSPYSYFAGGVAEPLVVRSRDGSGPGGGRGSLPSDSAGSSTRTDAAPGAAGTAGAAGGAHAGSGGGHPGGGKP